MGKSVAMLRFNEKILGVMLFERATALSNLITIEKSNFFLILLSNVAMTRSKTNKSTFLATSPFLNIFSLQIEFVNHCLKYEF